MVVLGLCVYVYVYEKVHNVTSFLFCILEYQQTIFEAATEIKAERRRAWASRVGGRAAVGRGSERKQTV